jgi:hypothetical protein
MQSYHWKTGMTKKWLIPGVMGFVLLAVLGLQVVAQMRPVPEGSLQTPLSESIPMELEGWQVEDMDLGPTESVIERSHDLLRLDDFVHRAYAKGSKQFSVYVAYWEPGKMPVRLVNQHTPDRCWTEVGWVCEDRQWNVERTVRGQQLQPAQWGVYTIRDYRNYTYFWHVVGGEVHWYGGERINTRTSLSSVWEDFQKFGLNVHREQFFVRIVSPEPMDALWDEPGFQTVMESLAELCLAEPGSPEGSLAVQ